MSKEALLVAAIDFGTTYSGYAFSFRHEFKQDPLRVSSSVWSTGSSSITSLKTSSTILFKPNGQFDSFGFEAEDRYSDLAMDNQHSSWFYFRRFKMMLYESKEVHRTSKISDMTGKEMTAMDVFAEAIKYLKNHLMQSCRERTYDIVMEDIKWVLTVPAIWDDAAKQFMREAAQKAGIDGERLSLALEPEAASIFCKHLPVERIAGSNRASMTCFQENSKYLVLDAGGGTIDITVHEVLKDGKLKELHKASGGAWGGTTIDKSFTDFIERIVGTEVMTRFHEVHKDDYIDLLREFEVKKRTVTPDLEAKVTFKIPISMHELYRDVHNAEIREAIRRQPDLEGKVTFAGDKMRVEAEVVKSLFTNTTEAIIGHLQMILKHKEAQGTSAILMVGGFSESPMLRGTVEKAFPLLKVITPSEAGLAVLKGAVIFGHNSTEIISRIAKYTYGFKIYKMFDPNIHPSCRMIINENGKQVQGVFEKLVEIGQCVSPGQTSLSTSCWPHANQSGFALKLFASFNRNPQFVDEEGCVSIGQVYVDCRDQYGQVSSASVCLIFGGTELEVQATNNSSGKKTTAVFNFLE